MPKYNVTVDNSSPFVIYSSGWNDAFPGSGDSEISKYQGGTFHSTSQNQTTATLRFRGTNVWIFGALRDNHDRYLVTLDGQTTSYNGFSASNSFQQPLFSSLGLPDTDHELIITNAFQRSDRPWLDVDYFVFTAGDESVNKTNTLVIDDSDLSISYSPQSPVTWQTSNSRSGEYYNGTLHYCNRGGASLSIPFEGDAIYLYGGTDTNHGNFSIRIDTRPAVTLNGAAAIFRPRTLLFYADNLGPGPHTANITNAQDLSWFDFDYAEVIQNADQNQKAPKAKTPIIAGVVSGVCIGLAWLVALIIYLRRRRKRKMMEKESIDHPVNPGLFEPEPFVLPPPSNQPPPASTSEYRQSTYGQPVVASSAGSPPSQTSDSQARSEALSRTSMQSFHTSTSPPPSNPAMRPSPRTKAVYQPLPATATQLAPSSLTPSELAASRMTVPDRPQDWGPVPPELQGLPPNYAQATQPMPRPLPTTPST